MSHYRRMRNSEGFVFFTKMLPKRSVKDVFAQAWKRIRRIITSRAFVAVMLSLLLSFVILCIIGLIFYARMLPDISNLAAARDQPGIELQAENGNVISRYGQISGKYIAYRYIPKHLVNAVIATEDRRFFSHYGVDPKGVLRAMVVNARKGRLVQGGSTITQQLAKNIFLTPDRTLHRKVQELMMAFWLERNLTKEEILEMYLNRVYMGAGSYGVEAASHYYFDKSAKELDLVESAMLAGLLKAPSRYNPTANKKLAIGRTRQVLLNMVADDKITQLEAKSAITVLESGEKSFKKHVYDNNRYFADWIREQIPQYIGEVTQDIVVTTTLEPAWQEAAQAAIDKHMTDKTMEARKVSEVAILSMRPNGAITSLIGGRDYNESQYNRATQAKRQPGSAFKPFVYLAAIERGYTPDMLMKDEKTRFGKWTPSNYSHKYRGVITLQEAMQHSVNTIAVKLSQYTGIDTVRNVAKRLGIKSEMTNLPSLALGAMELSLQELVTAYAHFANYGRAVKPYGITEIRTKRTNEVLYSRTDRDDFSDVMVIKPDDVAKMNVMLNAVIKNGTARNARIGRSSAGKTGTTSDYKDAWFVGYTPHIVAGVWVGNDNAKPTNKVTGGSLPARIWRDYVKVALADIPEKDLPLYYNPKPITPEFPWMPQAEAYDQRDRLPGTVSAPIADGIEPPDGLSGANDNAVSASEQLNNNSAATREPVTQQKDFKLNESFWDTLLTN